MLIKIARIIFIFHLLLASVWLYKLLTYKEGWEMGQTAGLFVIIGIFIYNTPWLIISFFVKRRWAIRLTFCAALFPWLFLLGFIYLMG